MCEKLTDLLTDKTQKNVHNFLTSHTIWLIFKLDQYILVTNIFTKFNEDWMKADSVREQTKRFVTDRRTD